MEKKKYRRIEALTSLKTPEKISRSNKSVFDIETINWTEPYAVGFYNNKNVYTQFKGKGCILDFLKFFLTKKEHLKRGTREQQSCPPCPPHDIFWLLEIN